MFLASVNQKPLAKASPESVGGSRARWRSRAETVQGAACVREALFRGVLATSRTFLLPASTRRQEEFEVQFVWLRKQGKFEATLRRGGGLAFISANNGYRMRGQSRIGAGKQCRINPLQAAGEDPRCNRSRIAALFSRYFLRQTASFPASARPCSG